MMPLFRYNVGLASLRPSGHILFVEVFRQKCAAKDRQQNQEDGDEGQEGDYEGVHGGR